MNWDSITPLLVVILLTVFVLGSCVAGCYFMASIFY